jgi:hypothetical protein
LDAQPIHQNETLVHGQIDVNRRSKFVILGRLYQVGPNAITETINFVVLNLHEVVVADRLAPKTSLDPCLQEGLLVERKYFEHEAPKSVKSPGVAHTLLNPGANASVGGDQGRRQDIGPISEVVNEHSSRAVGFFGNLSGRRVGESPASNHPPRCRNDIASSFGVVNDLGHCHPTPYVRATRHVAMNEPHIAKRYRRR